MEDFKIDYEGANNPEIYGTFTNWKPKRMYNIREFCNRVDRNKPNIFKMMQDAGLLDKDAESVNHLKDMEKEQYNIEWSKFYQDYSNTWKDVI